MAASSEAKRQRAAGQAVVKSKKARSSRRSEEPPRDEHDFYSFLGVARTASGDEIRKAYYRKAKLWHPDKVRGGDEADEAQALLRFKELAHVYSVLSDAEARRAYDQHGDARKLDDEQLDERDARQIYEAVMAYINSLKRVTPTDIEDFFQKMDRLRADGAVDQDEDALLRRCYAQFDGNKAKILRYCDTSAPGYEAKLDRRRYTSHIAKIAAEQK